MNQVTEHRISRRGFRHQIDEPRLSIEAPCLHQDAAIDDTGR